MPTDQETSESPLYCPSHQKYLVVSWCSACKKYICPNCTCTHNATVPIQQFIASQMGEMLRGHYKLSRIVKTLLYPLNYDLLHNVTLTLSQTHSERNTALQLYVSSFLKLDKSKEPNMIGDLCLCFMKAHLSEYLELSGVERIAEHICVTRLISASVPLQCPSFGGHLDVHKDGTLTHSYQEGGEYYLELYSLTNGMHAIHKVTGLCQVHHCGGFVLFFLDKHKCCFVADVFAGLDGVQCEQTQPWAPYSHVKDDTVIYASTDNYLYEFNPSAQTNRSLGRKAVSHVIQLGPHYISPLTLDAEYNMWHNESRVFALDTDFNATVIVRDDTADPTDWVVLGAYFCWHKGVQTVKPPLMLYSSSMVRLYRDVFLLFSEEHGWAVCRLMVTD